MKVRTLVLGAVAVGCGLVASVLTARMLSTNASEPPVTVLVASKPLPRGTTLRDYESLFTTAEVPPSTASQFQYVTSFEQLREKAKDHLLQKEMRKGEPLSLDYLIDRKAGLEYLVRPGYVAFAVRATPESSFSGLIQPDNHVKVMRVKAAVGGEKQALILMKNIRVLAVDKVREKQPDGAGQVPTTITLELTDAEAKTLNLAQLESPLALALIAHANQSDLEDRAGETDVPPRAAPVAPVVQAPPVKEPEPAKPAPQADHRLVIRSGEETKVSEWNDGEKRYFRSEILVPPLGEKK